MINLHLNYRIHIISVSKTMFDFIFMHILLCWVAIAIAKQLHFCREVSKEGENAPATLDLM